MDWIVVGAAGIIYAFLLFLLTTNTGHSLLGLLSGVGRQKTHTRVEAGDVLYDGNRYYRTVDVNQDIITVHFVMTVGELSIVGSDKINGEQVMLNGYWFDIVHEGGEAIELQGELPKKKVQSGVKVKHNIATPFESNSS